MLVVARCVQTAHVRRSRRPLWGLCAKRRWAYCRGYVLRESTRRPNSYFVLNGLSAYSSLAAFSYLIEAANQRHQGKGDFLVTRRSSHVIELLIVDEANRLKDTGLEQIRDNYDKGSLDERTGRQREALHVVFQCVHTQDLLS